LNTVSPDGKLPSKDALDAPYTPPDAPQLIDYTEQILAGSMLLGMDHAQRKITAADDGGTDIPKVSFDEAVQYLKGKIPVTKKEWDGLSDKLRFRAFTVAKLAEYDYSVTAIETAKQILAGNIKDGDSISQSWEDFKIAVDADSFSIKPGYWENVYRTNSASAYTAGKLLQYQKTNPAAYELFIIDDERTSDICKHLLKYAGQGLVIPADSWFWEKYGFPPYHYQCRTGFRAIYKSQINKDMVLPENITNSDIHGFKPMKGFGGNPLDNGNWYMMIPSQTERAIQYGILNEFNREENIFADFDSVWKGYTRYDGKDGGWYDLCDNPPNDWKTSNKPVVEELTKHGYKIKVIPAIQNVKEHYHISWSNPDIIINGTLSDIKTPEGMTSNAIKGRIKSAYEQGLSHVVLSIPDSMPNDEITKSFKRWKGEKHNRKMSVLLLYNGNISTTII
jgi:SPP1 gp7 family putative phage head morphogenesis protein